jgi:hypothetical protein
MIKLPARLAVAALLAALAGAGAAQTIYKYERPDGGVVYSDHPVKGAKLVERFELAQAPTVQRTTPQAQAPQPRSEAPVNRAAELDAADAEVRAAQKALEDAQARLQQGAEPQPGERIANAGGKSSRLTEDYFGRQAQLEQEVKDANQRLEQAYERRNQAK